MNLNYVSCSLGSDLRFSIKTREYTETDKSFISKKGKRVSKKKLLVPDTTLMNDKDIIFFYTFCFPEDTDKAKTILLNEVVKCYQINKEKFLKMIETFEANYNEDITKITTKLETGGHETI